MSDNFTGYEAPVYRALYLPRLNMGLPREVCAIYWGLWSLPLLCFKPPWKFWLSLAVLALAGHAVMAYAGRNDPYWFTHLKQKWHHPDVYTTHDTTAKVHDAYVAMAGDDPVLQEVARVIQVTQEAIDTPWPR